MKKLTTLAAAVLLLVFSAPSHAQQMVVDDAEITTTRSFQIESWIESEETWILPAFGVASWLEARFPKERHHGFNAGFSFTPPRLF